MRGRASWDARLKSSTSWIAMLTLQFHQDREHPAPWRAQQDRHITMMLARWLKPQ